MADTELIAVVATRIMGWGASTDVLGKPEWVNESGEHATADGKWRPLDDWNDAMAVVKAMREKGFTFMFADRYDDVDVNFCNGPCPESCFDFHPLSSDEAAQRRAILSAALAAVETVS